MKDKWLSELQNRMSDFEMDTPENLWAQIEAPEVSRGENKPRRRFLYLGRAAAVAAIISLVFIAGHFLNVTPPQIDVESMSVDHYVSDNEPDKHFDNAISAADRHEAVKPIGKASNPASFAAKEDTPSLADSLAAATAHIQAPEEISEDTSGPELRSVSDLDKPVSTSDRQYAKVTSKPKSEAHRMSVSVYSAGGAGSNSAYNSVSSCAMGVGSDGAGWGDSPLLGILLFNQGNVLDTEYKHRHPVRFGVSFAYRLTDRLALGSGLSYTGLTSDFRSGSQAHHIRGKQVLDYIGIPVDVTYNFLRWKRIELYGAAGVLGEQCVYAKTKTNYMINGIDSGADSKVIKDKPFQLSVNASLGLQFNIAGAVGVYAEPGISYYFNDGTDIKTIYKDKPLNFNLNIGVRITIDGRRSKP